MDMEKFLVSACLMGIFCRYDGNTNEKEEIKALQKKYIFIYICPECDGGLPIPRAPSERKNDLVINSLGEDNTPYFVKGAAHALEVAKKYGITKAILKSKSPSCGKGQIYDGTFSKKLIEGNGLTTDLLIENGIKVYTELEWKELIDDEQ